MRRSSLVVALFGLGSLFATSCEKEADRSQTEAAPPAAQPPAEEAQPPQEEDQAAGSGGRARGGPGRERGAGRQPLPEDQIGARVSNPSSEEELAVYFALPEGAGPHKAVIVVPGAVGDASTVMSEQAHVDAMLAKGIAVFKFDPDGRGNSGGEDDYNGKIHQEGLRAVIAYVIGREDVIDDGVGVISYSFGLAMSAGALAGGTTGARFLIDWEGPSSRDYIARCQDGQGQTQPPFPVGFECDDDQFWSEREAVDAIGGLQIPYLRIQRAIDHVHGEDSGHAMELLGAALEGGVPWVRLNDLQPGLDLPALQQAELPDVGFDELFAWFADWTEDMFVVAEGQEPAPRQHVPTTSAAPVRPKGPPARPAPLKRPGQ